MSVVHLQRAVFTTQDGAEIVYGFRRGPDTLVLLHALGCDASMWDEVVGALPGDAGLVVPELRGHGDSTLGWRPPSVDLWAEDLVALLRRHEVEDPAIAGLSMGGYTALAIEAAHPGLARAFAFIDTSAAPDDEAAKRRRADSIALIRKTGWRAYAEASTPNLLNPEAPRYDESRRRLAAMFERAGDSGLPPTLMALAARPDRRSLLPSIEAPTLVVVGALDVVTPPERAREIAARIDGARLQVLDNVAHLSAMEAPARLADLLATL